MNTNCLRVRRNGGGFWFLAALSLAVWSSTIHTADAAQFTVIDEVITITEANNGFYFWNKPKKGPKNWLSPENFYEGEFYLRFEVLDQPTDRAFLLQFCIWDDGTRESASGQSNYIGGIGSVSETHSSPSNWWKQSGGVYWNKAHEFTRFGIPVRATPMRIITNSASRPESQPYWADRADWFPMTVHVQAVAVSKGSTFSGFPSVPEPSTFALLATGLTCASAYAWRKRKFWLG